MPRFNSSTGRAAGKQTQSNAKKQQKDRSKQTETARETLKTKTPCIDSLAKKNGYQNSESTKFCMSSRNVKRDDLNSVDMIIQANNLLLNESTSKIVQKVRDGWSCKACGGQNLTHGSTF